MNFESKTKKSRKRPRPSVEGSRLTSAASSEKMLEIGQSPPPSSPMLSSPLRLTHRQGKELCVDPDVVVVGEMGKTVGRGRSSDQVSTLPRSLAEVVPLIYELLLSIYCMT